jgi:hypothetical protein
VNERDFLSGSCIHGLNGLMLWMHERRSHGGALLRMSCENFRIRSREPSHKGPDLRHLRGCFLRRTSLG